MNIFEEVQLAIDMGIESAYDYVILAKLNATAPSDGYWGMLNGKRVWLSRMSHGKLCRFELGGYYEHRDILGENKLLIREKWDNRVNEPFSAKYFTDEIFRLRYELKMSIRGRDWFALRAGLDDNNSEYLMSVYNDICDDIEKLKNKISYLKRKEEAIENGYAVPGSRDFDIPYLKSIPITNFVEVNRAGFFKIRNEKTPSCKYYKDENSWVDFGDDNKKHDVIDLICALHKISFREACLFLEGK